MERPLNPDLLTPLSLLTTTDIAAGQDNTVRKINQDLFTTLYIFGHTLEEKGTHFNSLSVKDELIKATSTNKVNY